MQVFTTHRELKSWRARFGGDGLGLVPTMGYLHEGHFSLVKESRRRAPLTAVSIFVNPTQFGPREDLSRYPRNLAGDLAALEALGVDVVYSPEPADLYPAGFDTWVNHRALSTELEGAFRPGHFEGVLTVVMKLFQRFRPSLAVFGRKDFQQLTVIRRMNEDLDLGIEVAGLPTVREASGLALSSRNTYLSQGEKETAVTIRHTLLEMKRRALSGNSEVAGLCDFGKGALEKAGFRVDYVAVRSARDLSPQIQAGPDSVALVAAHLGKTRLIDNLEFQEN